MRISEAVEQRSSGTLVTTIAAKRHHQSIMRSVTPCPRKKSSALMRSRRATCSSPKRMPRQPVFIIDR